MGKRVFFGSIIVVALFSISARPRPAVLAPTFNRDIVRILQQNCQECHRPGGAAPFPLIRFEEVAPRAYQISTVTRLRQMPPWKPQPGCTDLQGERRLSDQQITTLIRWVAMGTPEGDPKDLPSPLSFSDDWSLGPPDLVTGMEQMYWPPRNSDAFRCFVLPSPRHQDLFVAAVDFRSLARENVHHILVYVDDTGAAEILDSEDGEPGYECFGGPRFPPSGILGGWFPGSAPVVFPEGVAGRIKPESRIVIQVHYHSHGGPVFADITELGLYFVPSASRILRFLAAENNEFVIPAGAAAHSIEASVTIPFDIDLHTIGAHMHLLGRTVRAEAVFPDGRTECLLEIADWDPNWQGMYTLRSPMRIPAGTVVRARATYDNSENNPRNPFSPPRDVHWGEEAFNEMLSAYMAYSLVSGD